MATVQRPEKYPFLQIFIVIVCLALWTGGTFWYVTYAVSQSQRQWCSTFALLNEAPAPKAAPDNPSRTYAAKLAQDFQQLQREFGC